MADERKAILEAALHEFAEVGLNEATLDSIAGRAGLEPGAARALFIDKPRLLRELLRELTDPLVSGIAVAVEDIEDPRELLRKSLRLYDEWLTDHPDLVRVMVRCALDGAESLGALYQNSLLPSEFYERLQLAISRNQLRCKDLFVLSLLLDSLIMFPHMIRPSLELMEPEKTTEQTLKARLDAIMALFENGLYSA
jgi:AcrR family transcriptional regulator